ncbi:MULTISPECIES: TetR family transcriptional regulator [unclassified Mycolicibacterium]|uniref:TetR/AcrR family transcriptional regulator n=1 Tax=unclassified Mycolicibacterium TaxID=2636767 RepID=UPI001F4C0DE6|nr:TetR family transcriptional regulator [Mycolicibacterium sp. YH-1]UNB53738.1 TetR/AcrR family transcriptional regulator [Mycolicibacterium sp. YH-1]
MAELADGAAPGLRERKKQRTRSMLIDAAMELCLRQGYENTTVDQIAAAADVSPRTFSRYFATKDAVFLTLIDDYSHEVAIELETVQADVGPLEAMRQAHVAVLTRVAKRQVGRMTTERIILMLRVINASDTLRQAAVEFKHDMTEVVLAKRMGVNVEDRSRRLVGAVFSSTIVTACGDLISDTDTFRLGPLVMVDRINEAFAQVAQMSADLLSGDGAVHGAGH